MPSRSAAAHASLTSPPAVSFTLRALKTVMGPVKTATVRCVNKSCQAWAPAVLASATARGCAKVCGRVATTGTRYSYSYQLILDLDLAST